MSFTIRNGIAATCRTAICGLGAVIHTVQYWFLRYPLSQLAYIDIYFYALADAFIQSKITSGPVSPEATWGLSAFFRAVAMMAAGIRTLYFQANSMLAN